MFGVLGRAVLAADTPAAVYTVPAHCKGAELSINCLNPGGSIAVIKIAISPDGTPAAEDYVEDGASLPASGGVALRSGDFCSPGEQIIVTSNQAGVVVRVSGKEIT